MQIDPHTVILQDQMSGQPRWLIFKDPIDIIQTYCLQEITECLQRIDQYLLDGKYVAGFISYEASPAFDAAQKVHASPDVPLVWFGIYEGFEEIDLPNVDPQAAQLGPWEPSVSWDEYQAAIAKIKYYISNGDTYQVNFTFRLRNALVGSAWDLFLNLYQAQRSGYSAYIDTGTHCICSVSPELFFSLDGDKLTCRPMKGTVKRGVRSVEDDERAYWLANSEKNRAENVMIVDMIRNDMGKIARSGSVQVPKLFDIEQYPTVYQMTSTVTANVSTPPSQIIANMFPCASITGAPKVKTMEIIAELENTPRGIYTGSIGYLAPGRKIQLNVAIRTVVVEKESNRAEYGVGGGIVWDSHQADEYEECKAKAAVLTRKRLEFNLIESLLWTHDGGLHFLEHHIERLMDAAQYFRFDVALSLLRTKLNQLAASMQGEDKKIRLIADRSGNLDFEVVPLTKLNGLRVGLAKSPAASRSAFVFHKTTQRSIYEDARAGLDGHGDAILWNCEGHVTESCIANLVIFEDGQFLTPPLEHGLLPGVFRRVLLEQGIIKEKAITLQQFVANEHVFLINSVRGWMPLTKTGTDTWIATSEVGFETPIVCAATA